MKIPIWLTSRLNPNAFSLSLSIIIGVSGIAMIFLGIKDDGFIDIKSAMVSGQVKAGLVGVVLVFLGSTLAMLTILVKPPKHVIKIEKDNLKIHWEGMVYSNKEEIDAVKSFVDHAIHFDDLKVKNEESDDSD